MRRGMMGCVEENDEVKMDIGIGWPDSEPMSRLSE